MKKLKNERNCEGCGTSNNFLLTYRLALITRKKSSLYTNLQTELKNRVDSTEGYRSKIPFSL